jgi:glutamyl-tRNA reductase
VSLLVFGLNYRSAPVGLLERMAVADEDVPKAYASLAGRDHLTEAVVLSTCNRVEVYADVTRYHGGVADLRDFFAEWGGVAPENFADLTYDYYDDRAASHLFAVAAGLDSMALGEPQIRLQVKQAFARAEDEQAAGRLLRTAFTRALGVGKRARAETGIGRGVASMVDLALEAATDTLGELSEATALVLGAGKMGGIAASRLRGSAGRLLVANRSPDGAARLADELGAEVVDFAELRRGLAEADLVLSSTGSSGPVIGADALEHAAAGRQGRAQVCLDLAVPRDIEPASEACNGVTVLDIDALRAHRTGGGADGEVARAQAIVAEEVERFASWTRTVGVEPTIAALRARAEQVRADETARLSGRLGELDERQAAAVESLTRGIVNTLLHEPTVRLKSIADARGGEAHAAALRELFDLPEEGGG